MAETRIVVETLCPECGLVHIKNNWGYSYPEVCNGPGGTRRVLDSNSFMDEVAHAVMAWTWTIDAVPDMESPIEGLDLANRILDALAGGEL